MIVLGADTHKRSPRSPRSLAAPAAAQVDRPRSARAGSGSCCVGARLVWSESALEDCRHVSVALERFCSTASNASSASRRRYGRREPRRSATRGKSDLHRRGRGRAGGVRQASATLPAAAAPEQLDIRLLVDHRERLVRAARRRSTATLLLHLHTSARVDVAASALFSINGAPDRPAPRARRADDAGPHRSRRAAPPARAAPTRSWRLRPRSPTLLAIVAPQLLDRVLHRAAHRRQAGRRDRRADRFATDAKLARAADVADPAARAETHASSTAAATEINAAITIAITRSLPPRYAQIAQRPGQPPRREPRLNASSPEPSHSSTHRRGPPTRRLSTERDRDVLREATRGVPGRDVAAAPCAAQGVRSDRVRRSARVAAPTQRRTGACDTRR